MRIIDNKGYLFGKINIIDLAVILIILYTAGAMAHYSIKLARAPKSAAPVFYSEEKYKQLEGEVKVIREEYANDMEACFNSHRICDKVMAERGAEIVKLNAEITRLNGLINAYLKKHHRAERYFRKKD